MVADLTSTMEMVRKGASQTGFAHEEVRIPPGPPHLELDSEASNLLAHATRGTDVEERQLR
jgi:hypothetical protein